VNRRSERIAGEMQAELGRLVSTHLRDPRLSALVTIARVHLTSDLREATAWVTVLGDAEDRKSALVALSSATGYLRREVGQALKLRHVPMLRFELDSTVEDGDRVLSALDEALHADATAEAQAEAEVN